MYTPNETYSSALEAESRASVGQYIMFKADAPFGCNTQWAVVTPEQRERMPYTVCCKWETWCRKEAPANKRKG